MPGTRAVPSLRYLSLTPPFSLDSEGNPSGGFDRDGRANDLSTQALRPLFSENEMANASIAELAAKLEAATSDSSEYVKRISARALERLGSPK